MVITERAHVQVRPEQLQQLLVTYDFPIWLDSAKVTDDARYSILAAKPLVYIQQKDDQCYVYDECGSVEQRNESSLVVFNEYEEQFFRKYEATLPFHSGWLGFFSYDLHQQIETIPQTTYDDLSIPQMGIGCYDGVFIYDHVKEELLISAIGLLCDANKRIRYWQKQLKTFIFQNEMLEFVPYLLPLSDDISQSDYEAAFQQLKAYIQSGDLYQMNLTHRLHMPLTQTPEELYARLRTINPAPFAAYVKYDDTVFACSSPERFLKVRNGIISTRPIKGTRKRGETPEEDEALKQELWESEKDRAELLMIIDLERNDLAKISVPGTVKVPQMYTVEVYPTVFHLVSTIEAQIRPDVTPAQIIAATFPGGSITGAPKIRAMEIIDELEVHRRGIYTGSIGYIDCNRNMDLNIVIRTIVCQNNMAYFHVGGGIVYDSTVDFEYEETFQKAAALIAALEQRR